MDAEDQFTDKKLMTVPKEGGSVSAEKQAARAAANELVNRFHIRLEVYRL